MKLIPEVVTIDLDHLEPVLAAMDRFTATHIGWINIQPEIPEENAPPPPSMISQLFRSGAPVIALATWTPPTIKQPKGPQMIGVQHRLGAKLVPLLDDLGVSRPDDWRRIQDSPRRGLVVAVPTTTPHDEILQWLMRISRAATRAESTGMWVAAIHSGHAAA